MKMEEKEGSDLSFITLYVTNNTSPLLTEVNFKLN